MDRPQSAVSDISVSHTVSTELQPALTDAAFRDPPQTPATFSSTLLNPSRDLEGISGWLLPVAIGLVISPLMILNNTVKNNLPVLTNPRLHAFLETHPALEGLIVFEIATNLIFIAVLVGLNVLFFKKKRSFPTYMILYLCLHPHRRCGRRDCGSCSYAVGGGFGSATVDYPFFSCRLDLDSVSSRFAQGEGHIRALIHAVQTSAAACGLRAGVQQFRGLKEK